MDYKTVQVTIIGDPYCGKSSLIQAFIRGNGGLKSCSLKINSSLQAAGFQA
jgi:GTPase Era involved in 16S rRNA processing